MNKFVVKFIKCSTLIISLFFIACSDQKGFNGVKTLKEMQQFVKNHNFQDPETKGIFLAICEDETTLRNIFENNTLSNNNDLFNTHDFKTLKDFYNSKNCNEKKDKKMNEKDEQNSQLVGPYYNLKNFHDLISGVSAYQKKQVYLEGNKEANTKIQQIGCGVWAFMFAESINKKQNMDEKQIRNELFKFLKPLEIDEKIVENAFNNLKLKVKDIEDIRSAIIAMQSSPDPRVSLIINNVYDKIRANLKTSKQFFKYVLGEFLGCNGKFPVKLAEFSNYCLKVTNEKDLDEIILDRLKNNESVIITTDRGDHYKIIVGYDDKNKTYRVIENSGLVARKSQAILIGEHSIDYLHHRGIIRKSFTKKDMDDLIGEDQFAQALFAITKKMLNCAFENYVEENDKTFIGLLNEIGTPNYRGVGQNGDYVLLVQKNK